MPPVRPKGVSLRFATMSRMKTRWLRFSLRTMLLLITALSIWLGLQVNAARRQREAVAAILKAGGTVFYDYQMVPRSAGVFSPDRIVDPSQLPPRPAWLREQIGDDYFRTVVAVRFAAPRASLQKADLDELAKLPQVREFVFAGNGTDLSDKDFTALSDLRNLEVLRLPRTRVNGSILASLPNPERLKYLYLGYTDADNATLKHVGNMTML